MTDLDSAQRQNCVEIMSVPEWLVGMVILSDVTDGDGGGWLWVGITQPSRRQQNCGSTQGRAET